MPSHYAKGSKEAKDQMAKVRSMRGKGKKAPASSGSKPAKGSKEMKEKMAKLRAMRGKK